VALLVNFGFDLPLVAVRSAARRRFAMNFRCAWGCACASRHWRVRKSGAVEAVSAAALYASYDVPSPSPQPTHLHPMLLAFVLGSCFCSGSLSCGYSAAAHYVRVSYSRQKNPVLALQEASSHLAWFHFIYSALRSSALHRVLFSYVP
jgi:hypothetical protein